MLSVGEVHQHILYEEGRVMPSVWKGLQTSQKEKRHEVGEEGWEAYLYQK
jgi:hypothetical protein